MLRTRTQPTRTEGVLPMIDFSLILPSRERLPLLQGLIESVVKHTSRLDRVEMLVCVDWDDTPTVNAARGLMLQYPWLTLYVGERQWNLSVGYYNKLAKHSTGRYIQVLNDDCRFVTAGWDTLAVAVLDSHKVKWQDGIFYGRTFDDQKAGYSCFPLLSREALNAMGWFFHPESPGWCADIMLHKIFNNRLVRRVVDLPYHFEHLCHHTGKRERDAISDSMNNKGVGNRGYDVGEAMRLANIISSLNAI